MHVAIIGNGVAGSTAARYIRKLDSSAEITMISGESKYFFARTALMYVYMGHMKFEHTKPYEDWFWDKNRIHLKQDWVDQIEFDKQELQLKEGGSLPYDKLVLATGSHSRRIGIPGEDLEGAQGLYSLQDLQSMGRSTKNIRRAVVIGGGLVGIELAEMLHCRGIHVSFIIREAHFWGDVLPREEGMMIVDHMRGKGIEVILNTTVEQIVGSKCVTAVRTSSGDEIPCEFVGCAVGVEPNVSFLKGSALELDKGILVDQHLRTNLKSVYAIGDCAQFRQPLVGRRPIEQVWYTGRMMGQTVAHSICGRETQYTPGHWYNSSKFFDLEFQGYGRVSVGDYDFFWSSGDGTRSLRLCLDQDQRLIGMQSIGIRLRHNVANRWLDEKRQGNLVIQEFNDLLFDPEFSSNPSMEIAAKFNADYGVDIVPKSKNWERIMSV